MNIQLLGTRIIARLITPDLSDGGIALPECAGNTLTHRLADVLYVGPDVRDVKPFDRVSMDFRGSWVELDGERLISAHEENVLAVLEDHPSVIRDFITISK